MESNSFEMLLLYSVDDCVGSREGRSVKPSEVTPCKHFIYTSIIADKDSCSVICY